LGFGRLLCALLIEKHGLTQTFYHGLHGLFATDFAPLENRRHVFSGVNVIFSPKNAQNAQKEQKNDQKSAF